jgi:L-alanine-DL-glutamate epimerase-like enolase superfamily enzyme
MAGMAAGFSAGCAGLRRIPPGDILDQELDAPVFKRDLFPDPVRIASVELLRHEDNFICRVRSRDGAEGISVSNNAQMRSLYPIQLHRVQPFFIDKDARELDDLIRDVFVYQSNYKLQSLALWIPVATVEFAILDMMGRISGRPMGALFGEVRNRQVAVYRANNYRGKTAEESIDLIQRNVERDGARAVKFKVGARMRRNADDPPGRSEKLIPLMRRTFGDAMTIYADSNGSYDVPEAIRIGRMLETHGIDFYEEPVPFDWYEETRAVADALKVPIAGGEQESSLHAFRWLIGHRALQVVQPDMFYFGGMIRSTRVARMAQAAGCPCTPHISGSGLGYLYMMHFVSTLEHAGPYHEFKGFNADLPFSCDTSTLRSESGVVSVPTGPGLGVTIDPAYMAKHRLVTG